MTAFNKPARQIAFHAVIVLILGMVSGLFWGTMMADVSSSASQQAAWRLAHIEGFANGVLMLVFALAYPLINPQGWAEKIVRYGLIVTGYSNISASMYGGLFDARGLLPSASSSAHDLVVYYTFLPGVVAITLVLVTVALCLRSGKAPLE
ncbi:MAG: hypothetical protein HOC23_15495 [Halieaceae bacterium]|jgi:hypothetical protein|nr:hypothetical protein [Halieaceae bacterium]